MGSNSHGLEPEPESFNMSSLARYASLLSDPVDEKGLRQLCWRGIPCQYRGICWKYLLGYLPTNRTRSDQFLVPKRQRYFDQARSLGIYPTPLPEFDPPLYRQIRLDIPRTHPNYSLFKNIHVQTIMERVLYCWSIRHPACGYVQGLNDILSLFVVVFLTESIVQKHPEKGRDQIQNDCLIEALLNCSHNHHMWILQIGPWTFTKEELDAVEADSFWCFNKLLEPMQSRYVSGQPGILEEIHTLQTLVGRIDGPLTSHLRDQGVELMQFAFRWINCLLLREIPLPGIIRLWDTCLSEERGFTVFYTFVMAAFLRSWSDHIQSLEFQDIILFLQDLPTKDWTCEHIEMIASEAFLLQTLFRGLESHHRPAT